MASPSRSRKSSPRVSPPRASRSRNEALLPVERSEVLDQVRHDLLLVRRTAAFAQESARPEPSTAVLYIQGSGVSLNRRSRWPGWKRGAGRAMNAARHAAIAAPATTKSTFPTHSSAGGSCLTGMSPPTSPTPRRRSSARRGRHARRHRGACSAAAARRSGGLLTDRGPRGGGPPAPPRPDCPPARRGAARRHRGGGAGEHRGDDLGRRPGATATGRGAGTRAWARSSWVSRSCARAATSPRCSSRAGARSAPSSRSSRRPTSRASRRAASTTSCARSAARASPRARSRASAPSSTRS